MNWKRSDVSLYFRRLEATMLPLTLILHIFIGSTLSGSAVIAALVSGYDTLVPILIAAAIGFIGSVPVSWIVAKKIAARA